MEDGKVTYVNFFDSYGTNSPGTPNSYFAFLAYPSGYVGYNYADFSIFGSYGVLSPDIRYTSFWWVDISGAPDSYLHNDVSYSYGNFSPGTISNLVVWYILRDGMSNFDYTSFDGELIDYSLLYSYGSPMTAADIVTYGAWDVWTSGAVEFYNGYAFSSYGLYSPDTSDIQFVWMVFPSGFINHNLDYTISYSYGSALRARFGTIMPILSILPVTSTAATMSTVPTGAFHRTSPNTDDIYYACFVWSSGIVIDSNYSVRDSYGIFLFALRARA